MTIAELKQKITEKKIQAFDFMRLSRDIDPKHMGHKSYGDFCAATVKRTGDEIEKMIQKWEKENPD